MLTTTTLPHCWHSETTVASCFCWFIVFLRQSFLQTLNHNFFLFCRVRQSASSFSGSYWHKKCTSEYFSIFLLYEVWEVCLLPNPCLSIDVDSCATVSATDMLLYWVTMSVLNAVIMFQWVCSCCLITVSTHEVCRFKTFPLCLAEGSKTCEWLIHVCLLIAFKAVSIIGRKLASFFFPSKSACLWSNRSELVDSCYHTVC